MSEPVPDDPFDVPLEDPELLAEVELLASVFIAADETQDRPLDQTRIDRALGLHR